MRDNGAVLRHTKANKTNTSLGTLFSIEGFMLEQGLEWSGGETFDDLC